MSRSGGDELDGAFARGAKLRLIIAAAQILCVTILTAAGHGKTQAALLGGERRRREGGRKGGRKWVIKYTYAHETEYTNLSISIPH